MPSTLVIDIETIPNTDVADLKPDMKADGRLKDKDKIAASIEKKQGEAVHKMGLNPDLGRICVIGYACRKSPKEIITDDHHIKEATDAQERSVLRAFWKKVESYEKICTFNGAGFDIPFIMRRSWLLGVRPTRKFPVVPWKCATRESDHIDVRLVLSMGNPTAKGKLDFYGQLKLGEGKTDGIDGSQVWPMWQDGRIDEICSYGRDDCALTLRLLESTFGYYIDPLYDDF